MLTTDRFRIHRATPDEATIDALARLLIDVVEGGASVGFLLPLTHERAQTFWRNIMASAARGERIVLVAQDTASDALVGTVQLVLSMPENQPHRGEIAKMQVHRNARRTGLGAALLRAIEAEALAAGRSLLVLDTATGSDAERLYSGMGWQRCGEIPNYARMPDGTLCSTTLFYKNLAATH